MKTTYSILLAAAILLMACNNNKPKEATIVSEDGKEKISVDVNKMQNAAQDMQKQKEDLEKLTPLTLEQLKALIPETLMGSKRTKYEAANAMGAGFAKGEYKLNDSAEVKLNIFDCAGPGGIGIYSMQYMGMFNMQSESDDEYTKTIDFNGGKGFEHCEKMSNNCSLTYFAGNRFLVTLEGDHVGVDALKQIAQTLNIK